MEPEKRPDSLEQLVRLEEQVSRLEEVLRFYARTAVYREDPRSGYPPVLLDGGVRARQVLET